MKKAITMALGVALATAAGSAAKRTRGCPAGDQPLQHGDADGRVGGAGEAGEGRLVRRDGRSLPPARPTSRRSTSIRKMMGMVHGGNGGELAHKMKYMVIHTYEYPKAGMYKDEDVEAYRKKLQDGSWSCSVHTKDKSGTTDICSRTSSTEGSEMVILTAEPKELTFIHMSGNVSLDELSHMSGAMGGDGSSRRAPRAPVPPTPPAAPVAPVAPVAPAPPR